MKDAEGSIIYVGKAKNLKKRVSSYFLGKKEIKTEVLVSKIDSIEYILTGSEFEALLLENNLIKKWTPRYNIDLKDGKTYPVIKITKEKYPRVYKTRRVLQDGSSYFGPFQDVNQIIKYLDVIENLFPLRKCRGRLKKRKHPCLYYHIKKCRAPCCGYVSHEEYHEDVERIRNLLKGKTDELRVSMKKKMEEASLALEYEEAARFRDILTALVTLEDQQKIVDFDPDARDYVGYAADGSTYAFLVFQMREGRISGRENFISQSAAEDQDSYINFLLQYYSQTPAVPGELYLNTPFPLDLSLVDSLFRREEICDGRGRVVKIFSPQKGRHKKLADMAAENAQMELNRQLRGQGKKEALESLKESLSLATLPLRIEGFDIAQLNGLYPVASLISFYQGLPDRKNYRRFHMKSLGGKIDDYKAISEAVARRYTRLLNEKKEKPDLILIDGGKGQVNAAYEVLSALGLEKEIPVVGLAKKEELLFFPHRSDALDLPEGDPGLKILQHLRDETHRFATDFNQKLRRQRLDLSLLKAVPGVGPTRGQKVLEEFGSLQEAAKAGAEELSERGRLPLEVAETLSVYLQKNLPEKESGP